MPKTLDKAEKRDRIRRKKKDGMVVTGKSVFNIIQILVNRRTEVSKISKSQNRERKNSKKDRISSDREEAKKKKSRKNYRKRREEKESLSYNIIKQDSW